MSDQPQTDPSSASPRPRRSRIPRPSIPRPTLGRILRTRIVAGLLTIIPIWFTWIAVKFVFDLMTSATKPMAAEVSEELKQRSKELELLPEKLETYLDYIRWTEPIIATALTLFFLYLLGLLTANVFGRRILNGVERLVDRLPIIKTVYRSTKQIVTTLGGGKSMKFQRVVLVEFPRPGMKCIAFLTSVMKDIDTGREMATVFISTTPNPTTGYMQIVPLDEVSETGWTVEDAVKVLMSGGILAPAEIPFDKIHPVQKLPAKTEDEGVDLHGMPATTPVDTTEASQT